MLVLLVATYVLYCGSLFFYQERIIFPHAYANEGHTRPSAPSPSFLVGSTPVYLAEGVPPAKPRGLIICFHGNDETAHQSLNSADTNHFRTLGLAVAIPEYRGYANCPGSPSQDGIVTDMIAVVDHLKSKPEYKDLPVFYAGYSLGGGVACALAQNRPADGIILRCSFVSVKSFATGMGVPSFLVRHPFDNAAVLKNYTKPVLILHATNDQIVPIAHSRALAQLTPKATFIELPGDHFGFNNRNAYDKAVGEWFQTQFAALQRP